MKYATTTCIFQEPVCHKCPPPRLEERGGEERALTRVRQRQSLLARGNLGTTTFRLQPRQALMKRIKQPAPATPMASKHRPREDEDSHNYVEEESEALTCEEPSEEYVYSYSDTILDFLSSKRVLSIIGALLLAITAAAVWTRELAIRSDDGADATLPAGPLLLAAAGAVVLVTALDYTIEGFSHARLKAARGDGTIWYYANELSFYIALVAVLLAAHLYAFLHITNFYFHNPYALQLYLFDAFRILLIATLLLAIQKMAVKHISMGFNYNHYVNRIRRCLLFDFFISLASRLSEIEAGVLVDGAGDAEAASALVFQKKFRARSLESLGFGAKRVLIKEFLHTARRTMSYSGSLPVIFGKIRALAARQAGRLLRRQLRQNAIECMGDFERYFRQPELFEYFLQQLELSRSERVDRANVVRLIERAYREQYLIYKNIEQVSAAIDKVARCVRWATVALALVLLYVSAMQDVSVAFGAVSAIFGSHVINRVVSDDMLKSLVFLFLVHPFDIGDRVAVRLDGAEENLVVAELNVFSTLFYRWDGTSVFVPNHVLAGVPVTNVRRSGPTMETHAIQINTRTDPERVAALRQGLVDFCRAYPESFTDYVLINYERIEDTHKLCLRVLVQYQTNWQNYESYLKKKTAFLMELNRLTAALGISYDLPVQRIVLDTRGAGRGEAWRAVEGAVAAGGELAGRKT